MNTAVVQARATTSIGMFREDGGPGGSRSDVWVMGAWARTALSGSTSSLAALNAIQISELLVGASLPSYFGQRAS